MEQAPETISDLADEKVETYRKATSSLREQAIGHANLGRFGLVERPSGYFQDFRDVYFPPSSESNLDVIEGACKMIMGVDRSGRYNFDRLLVSFREKPQPVTEAAEIMSGGGRVLLVTPHRELADVAMAMAALQVTVADPEIIKKTRIFAGPIIKELEIIGIPAIEALHYSTGILVGFPDTENTNRKIDAQEIDPRLVSETNDLMLKEFRDQVSRGDISLVATAPSGSTDFESDSEIVMKPVSRSTNTLGRRYFDAILPVALVIGSDGTEAEVGDLTRLKAGENLHDVMEQSLAPMYSRIAGKRVVYERPAAGPRISRRSRLGRVAI